MTDTAFLQTLEAVIADRLRNTPADSYTAGLARQGIAKAAQKLGEEGVELALASVLESDARVAEEAADLVFHLLVLLAIRGIPLREVIAELERRHRAADR